MPLVGALAVQIIAPTAAFVLAWPVLAASACAALTGWGTRRGAAVDLPALVIAILSLAWLGGLFHSLLQGLDDIGLVMQNIDAIEKFEKQHHDEMPWLA